MAAEEAEHILIFVDIRAGEPAEAVELGRGAPGPDTIARTCMRRPH
jgi:hypothetical protein